MKHKTQFKHHKQQSFLTSSPISFRYSHGGSFRKKRKGRGMRPLSTKASIHIVFKAHRSSLRVGYRSPRGFKICHETIKRYAKLFFVKIEEQAICPDHIHLLIRLTKRSHGLYFLRVVAGQIAQQYQQQGLMVTDTPRVANRGATTTSLKTKTMWKDRPFTRIIAKGLRPLKIIKSYIRLNELEARGKIPYRKERLKGLSSAEWELLWA
jgi:REP element-mobilizing transposase RayT